MSNERVKMSVVMDVTVPQALTLQAMFKTWNAFASRGHSDVVGFYVDGDGDFHPNCEVTFDREVPELTDEMVTNAADCNVNCEVAFDYDSIAWMLRGDDER